MAESYYTLESLEAGKSFGFLIKRCGIVMTQIAERPIPVPARSPLYPMDGADVAASASTCVSLGAPARTWDMTWAL